MSPSVPAFLLGVVVLTPSAFAGRTGGGSSGGGGPLHGVSSGMNQATSSGSPPASTSGSNTGTAVPPDYSDYSLHARRWCEGFERPEYRRTRCLVVGVASAATTTITVINDERERRRNPASFHFYAAGQKVHDSDGAISLEAAVEDNRFRLTGTYTRFWERQPGDPLTLSMPTLAFGLRVDDGGATRVHLEGGMAIAKTSNDPVMDTSITGVLFGIRVQHPLTADIQLVGDAQAMLFSDDIRAKAGRLGVRFHGAQLSMRVVDFNVGPALWGPELGFGF